MAENETEQTSELGEEEKGERRLLSLRNGVIAASLFAVLVVFTIVLSFILYRTGTFDSYIKDQFVEKMNYMGIDFTADVFRVTASPLELQLKNATFNDRKTGEKLFFIREGRIGLTILNLFAWRTTRDIKVDSTEIYGAEIWVKFDETGRSNFANIVEDTRSSNLNFKYNSIKFSLQDSVVYFGDLSRTVSGSANNLQLFLEPEKYEVPDEQKRYKIDLTSIGSMFAYADSKVENVNLKASALADGNGAEITELRIETPIGESMLSGRITDWATPKYDLNVESTLDLTQASTIFPLGATLRGVGNFKGKVTGEGETYKIDGQIDSQALTAEGVYLKGFNVAATVAGTNTNYLANGNAVAELLTFEDFRVDFPKLAGNVRGTGSDFRWVGELQAVAAKAKSLSIVGLFLRDAVAEYKDKQFTASSGSGRAQKFSISDTEFSNLNAGDVRFSRENGVTSITSPSAHADSMKTPDYRLDGITGRDLKVRDTKTGTDVDIDGLTARNATLKDNKAANLRADRFSLKDRQSGTSVKLDNLQAERVTSGGTVINGVSAPSVDINDDSAKTLVYADRLRIARIDGGGAVLGSLNIAGVRLTIRDGTVSGTSDDIDAGDVAINKNEALKEGGTLRDAKIRKPVFVVEPSGRYRASADMSIGGGTIGSIPLGNASAKVNVNEKRVELNELAASVMNGTVNGNASIAYSSKDQSVIAADFSNLDISKIIALQGGRVIPFEGKTTGRADITLNGTDIRSTSGTIKADIKANAGNAEKGTVPVNGNIELSATSGLFNVDLAKLSTGKSSLTALGRFDVKNEDSNLDIALDSSDAGEIDRLIRVLGISSDLEQQLDSFRAAFSGDLSFNGKITGSFTDPTINGKASIASVSLRGREIGSISSDIEVSPSDLAFRSGLLREPAGGTVTFTVQIPRTGENNASVKAELKGIDAGNLLAAFPVDLPEQIRDFKGKTSGTVDLSGLPDASRGEIQIASTSGTIGGQAFDSLKAKAVFSGTLIDIQSGEVRISDGVVAAKGTYNRQTTSFDLDLQGRNVPLPLVLTILPKNDAIPTFAGATDFTGKAAGIWKDSRTYNVSFDGTAHDVVVNENPFGAIEFKGTTSGNFLKASLTAMLDGRPQLIGASVNFGDANLPITVETSFDKSPLAPFFAFVPRLRGIPLTGVGTGTVAFGGDLLRLNDRGEREISAAALSGNARFTQLDLLVQDTPLSAAEPIFIKFSPREVEFVSAKFAGGGSNLTIAGIKALTEDGVNNLSINGRINLALLNAFPQVTSIDTFFGGFADVSIRLAGIDNTARLSGTAVMQNAAVAAFIGSSRLSFDRLQGRILFTSNQAQIETASGYLGGGRFNATGGVLFGEGLSIDSFRVAVDGTNVTVPLPQDFITTGDARIEFSGRRISNDLAIQIAGNILARRSVYSRDIELSNIVGARREGSLSSGPSSLAAPRFDLTIEGRDALVVKNNIADLTASVSLRLTGTTDSPQLTGRITANSGTVFFRKDRYIVQRGVLEFPPDTAIEPVIFLQAETEIQGYQVFVNLSGPLTDTDELNASVRSSPALPSQDVLSLMTTGTLSNTEGGLPTFAQTGINTAAEVLTDSIINAPVRKATDKLFGLNVFEIDPIISGQRLNPSARLTVGRQINNNLRVTYATNLSQDQNQVVALEYRLSNKLSVVAQYEQRSLSNVTNNRDNFSIEVRFRKRF